MAGGGRPQGLCHLTADPAASVRRRVCEGLNSLVSNDFGAVLPHITGVIEFMLHSMQPPPDADADDDAEAAAALALEALWFWQCVVEAGSSEDEEQAIAAVSGHAALQPYLPRLLPAILGGMVLEEDDPAMDDADPAAGPDAHVPDRPQDVAPLAGPGGGGDDGGAGDVEEIGAFGTAGGGGMGGDGGDGAWNRRAGSAAALDLLADAFPEVRAGTVPRKTCPCLC